MDKLDWLEQNGRGNLDMRVENTDLIRSQANTMLAIALSGGGAALYFAAKEHYLVIAALLVSAYLFWIAFRITEKCIVFKDYPSSWNTPKNLNQPNYELDQLRKFELDNIQSAIEQATAINKAKSAMLNWYIKALCLTPVAAIAAYVLECALVFLAARLWV